MRRAKEGESWFATVCTTRDPKTFPVSDVNGLGAVIERLTNTLCDGSNAFSTDSIIVNLVSPDACDLTVVDLPGIIRTATAGQSVAMIDQVNKLIKSFLIDRRTIILAVIPANQDIATIDILERAQGVDPHGERTVGVLTKPDLIGPGGEDETLAVVKNVRKPLALGYVMLKNRSQRDINNNVSTMQARDLEREFFRSHPVFGKLDSSCYGIESLSKKLTNLLVTRIQQELVPMKTTVEKELGQVRATLRQLNAFNVPKTSLERQKMLVMVMQEYLRHLTDAVRGEYKDRIMVQNPELRLYTLALKSFEDFQARIEDTAPKFKEDEFARELSGQIDQLRGRELPGFLSSQAFYMCLSQYVEKWNTPLKALLTELRATSVDVAAKLADAVVTQYPALRQTIRGVAARILSDAIDDCMKKLEEVVGRERDPFTLNEFLQQWVNKLRFDRFADAVDDTFDDLKVGSDWGVLKTEVAASLKKWYVETHSISALANAKDMSAIMEAYWHLSAKRFVDTVCMLADKELLGNLAPTLQEEMYGFVRDDKKLEEFFAEDLTLAAKRKETEARRDQLLKAAAALAAISVKMPAVARSSMREQGVGGPDAWASDSEKQAAVQVNAAAQPVAASSGSGSRGNRRGGGRYSVAATKFEGEDLETLRQTMAASDLGGGATTLELTVNIGSHGLGILVSDADMSKVTVKGFRDMPAGVTNPSVAAGVRIGDTIVQINGIRVGGPEQAIPLLKTAQSVGQPLKLTVSRS
jgi:interferon-induced GTP-binding protein Mx1